MLDIHLKQNHGKNSLHILDEQNLVIIFSTIVESFEHDNLMEEFISTSFIKILKLKKSQSSMYESFLDARFKFRVAFEESFRMFVFKVFEDSYYKKVCLNQLLNTYLPIFIIIKTVIAI